MSHKAPLSYVVLKEGPTGLNFGGKGDTKAALRQVFAKACTPGFPKSFSSGEKRFT
jgi:hypothetical protein